MKKQDFIAKAEAQMKELFPDQKVSIQKVETSHGTYTGLTVSDPKKKYQSSAIVDLDRFYTELKIHSFDFIFDEMVKLLEMHAPDEELLEIITNFDKARDHLIVEPVEFKLPGMIGLGPDDMFLAVKIVIDIDNSLGFVTVTQKLLDLWHQDKDDIITQAIKNTVQ